MIELTYGKTSEYSGNVCLGFFDCVHKGHLSLINEAKKDGDAFVFTFTNDISSYLKNKVGYIYSYGERLVRLEEENVKGVIGATFDEKFMATTPEEFLDTLNRTLKIKRIICGDDYTFGKFAKGKIKDLKEYFESRNIPVTVLPLIKIDNVKASTSYAKELLTKGEIEKLNYLLVKPYRISGTIAKGEQNGSKLGFPTANIKVPIGQTRIKEGVYGGYVYLKGKKYKAIINAGARPTYDSYEYRIESYIDGKFGALYGENITVEFAFKIRDIMKFDCAEGLRMQLSHDLNALTRL